MFSLKNANMRQKYWEVSQGKESPWSCLVWVQPWRIWNPKTEGEIPPIPPHPCQGHLQGIPSPMSSLALDNSRDPGAARAALNPNFLVGKQEWLMAGNNPCSRLPTWAPTGHSVPLCPQHPTLSCHISKVTARAAPAL